MGLARHLQKNHLDTSQHQFHKIQDRFTPSPSISKVERRPATITAMEKGTGRTNAPGSLNYRQEADLNKPSETVKYSFMQFHDQDYEFESPILDTVSPFYVGSLKKNFSFWSDTLKANSFVLNVISSGYLIPFFESPPSVYLKNNCSAI